MAFCFPAVFSNFSFCKGILGVKCASSRKLMMKRTDVHMMKVKQFSDKDIPGQNEERRQPAMDNDVIEASGQENKKKPEAGLSSKEGSDDKQ